MRPGGRGRRIAGTFAAASLLAAAACSLTATDGLSGGGATPDAGQDGAPETADGALADAAIADAAEEVDAADAAPPLLANGDFEEGCAGWAFNVDPFGSATGTSEARSGAGACQVCSGAFGDAGALFYSRFEQRVALDVPPGSAIDFEVWVAPAPNQGSPLTVFPALRALSEDAGELDEEIAPGAPVASGYTRLNARLVVEAGGARQIGVAFWMSRASNATTCVVIDDARVTITAP